MEEIVARVKTIEGAMANAESRVLAIEAAIASTVNQTTMETIIDAKIKTAIQMSDNGGKSQMFYKPILESRAISEVGKLTDAKSYRPWNRKMKNAIDQIRPKGRQVIEMLESITEDQITNASARDPKTSIKETVIDVYLAILTIKHPDLENNLDDMNKDLWAILDAKAEGEALGKMKSVPQGGGLIS